MSAKVILTAKMNSFPFEDRVIILDVPAKIGRSHREDQADSSNAFFDCKVLSRQHAMILYEEGSFNLIDTGSSNGSFVNNIRLSKANEESKLTRIYNNDILRFGSDVVDKARQVTQKCVVSKIQLYRPDGTEEVSRPPESRLFRPNDAMEDLSAITQTLQEALTREKVLEEKLLKVRGMISRNIGKTHTDLLRLFENVKQEVMAMYEEQENASANFDTVAYEKIMTDNITANRRVQELERTAADTDSERRRFIQQQQEDSVEILTLRKACQLQKKDIAELEEKVRSLKEEAAEDRSMAEEKLSSKVAMLEKEKAELVSHYKGELCKQEEAFLEERTRIKEQLHDVTSNEVNLLNRIKCLEAEESYSHAEVERILVKEREMDELHQGDQYRIECLEGELEAAKQLIRHQESQVTVKRFDEDIQMLAEQEATIKKLREEVAYLKQELIEARARKSASDDELGTVKGKVETLENSIEAMSTEGENLRKTLADLQDELDERTREANHLADLVDKMEASSTHDEVIRTEISDLKHELAEAEATNRSRNEDILQLKRDYRLLEETLQQKEIDISCLRGQVQNAQEELDLALVASERAAAAAQLEQQFNALTARVDSLETENGQLEEDLKRQRTLYHELKKMRGSRGDEFETLMQCQQDLEYYQSLVPDLEGRIGELECHVETLQRPPQLQQQVSLTASEAAMQTVGSLRLYELTLGLIFLIIIIDWTFF